MFIAGGNIGAEIFSILLMTNCSVSSWKHRAHYYLDVGPVFKLMSLL